MRTGSKMIDNIKTPIGNVEVKQYEKIIDPDKPEKTCQGLFQSGKDFHIIVQSTLQHDLKRQTLLHEILHAFEVNMGYDLTEKQIDSIATQLYYFMKNNPEVVEWIQK